MPNKKQLREEWRESDLYKDVDSHLPLVLGERVAKWWLDKFLADLSALESEINKLTIFTDEEYIHKSEVLILLAEYRK